MNQSQLILPEFDDEMRRTRVILEHVPADKLDWKLSDDFKTIGWNANHLADCISWTPVILQESEFDIHPPGQPPHDTPDLKDVAAIISSFDSAVSAARELILQTTDETFAEPWTMKMQGQILFTTPKYYSFRTWIMNHSIHHRGILSVYLRMAGVKLTPVYDG